MLGSARVENEFMFRHIQVRDLDLDLYIDNAEKSPLFYIHTYVRKNDSYIEIRTRCKIAIEKLCRYFLV